MSASFKHRSRIQAGSVIRLSMIEEMKTLPPNMSFGQIIRKRRLRFQMRQSELGSKVGCSDTMIGKIETGNRFPDISQIPQFAHILKIDLAQLSIVYLRRRCPRVYEALQSELVELDITQKLRALPKELRLTVEDIIDKLASEEAASREVA